MDLEAQESHHKNLISDEVGFDSNSIRLGFIRKVYLIICAQLLVTILLCVLSMAVEGFRNFQMNNLWLFYVVIALYFITFIVLVCGKKAARKVPLNFILLFLFTLCTAYMVSIICSAYDPTLVIIAALMTLAVTMSLTVYAFTTKTDFTICGGLLFVLASTLLIMGLFMWIFHAQTKVLYIFYLALGVIVYGIYLVYDTQLIVGGKRHELDIDDYVIGAVIIYLDIIILFIRILELIAILTGKK